MKEVLCYCGEVPMDMKHLDTDEKDKSTYVCSICKRVIVITPWDTNPYQEAYVKFIKYVLKNELPHETSWTEAQRIKDMMEFDGDWIE